MPRALPGWDASQVTDSDEDVIIAHNWDELRRFMWDYVGIVRTNKRLQRAQHRVRLLLDEIDEFYSNYKVSRDLIELRNLAQVAELMIRRPCSARKAAACTTPWTTRDAARGPRHYSGAAHLRRLNFSRTRKRRCDPRPAHPRCTGSLSQRPCARSATPPNPATPCCRGTTAPAASHGHGSTTASHAHRGASRDRCGWVSRIRRGMAQQACTRQRRTTGRQPEWKRDDGR
jgi:hypothetical protein